MPEATAAATGTTTATTAAAATTTAAAATTAAATATTAAAQSAWHGYTDQADLDYVKNKGWQSGADAVKGYREAEKFIGKDPSTLIQLPRADDPNGLLAVFDRLGRPASADKYEFAKPPEGLKPDESYQKWAAGTFHKIGLTAGMVKELTAEHNTYVAAQLKQQETDYATTVAADKKTLLGEWRGGHERMMNVAKSAAQTLGFTPEMIDGIERTAGYAGTWKFFATLGQKLGEPGFVTSTGTPKFEGGMTPAEALAEHDKMKGDKNIMAALLDKTHPDNARYQKKQNDLYAIMYPATS